MQASPLVAPIVLYATWSPQPHLRTPFANDDFPLNVCRPPFCARRSTTGRASLAHCVASSPWRHRGPPMSMIAIDEGGGPTV